MWVKWPIRSVLISHFCSLKPVVAFVSLLDGMLVRRRVTPSIKGWGGGGWGKHWFKWNFKKFKEKVLEHHHVGGQLFIFIWIPTEISGIFGIMEAPYTQLKYGLHVNPLFKKNILRWFKLWLLSSL